MYIDSFNYTNKGKYPVNEDSFFSGDNVFIVADGLGGHGGGNIASACAVQYIFENYRSAQEITELISGANNAVRELNNGSRSTVAAAFVEGGKFHYTNIGDSRVYIFRNGSVLCRTKDHSVCQAAVDAGTMTEDEIRGHEDRSRLLRVLGETESLKLTNYEPITLRDGDAFLICSDGFWDFVYETEMEADLLKSDSAKRWGEYMLRRHLKRSRCEDDNFTLVCGIFHMERDDVPLTAAPAFSVPVTSSPIEVAFDEQSEAAPRSFSARRVVIGVAIGVVVLAALCAAAYLFILNRSDNSPNTTEYDESVTSSAVSTDSAPDSEVGGASDSDASGEPSENSGESGNSSDTSDETFEDSSSEGRESGDSSDTSDETSEESSSKSSESSNSSDTSDETSEESNSESGESDNNSDTSDETSEGNSSESSESDDSSETSEPSESTEDSRGFPLPPILFH